MKKIVALMLVLVMSIAGVFTSTAPVLDTPEQTKIDEWVISYARRCNSYKTKKSHARAIRFLKKVALAPAMLFLGTFAEYKPWKFSGEERCYEVERRRRSNSQASNCLSNPARFSAEVFSNGLIAASAIIGKDAGELHGKNLFEAIVNKKNKKNEIKEELEEIKILRETDPKDKDLYNRKRSLEKEREEIKAELKVLRSAVTELTKDATTEEMAAINAEAASAKARAYKRPDEVKEGRKITVCDKPILKSYKIMHFDEKAVYKFIKANIDKVNDKAHKCFRIMRDESKSDDDLMEAKIELRREFNKLSEIVANNIKEGKRINLNASFAKIHNSRQSQLSDIIGVNYGKTTDMIISISHNVANVFNKNVMYFIDDEIEKASNKVDALMENILQIATLNGFEVETENRKINYTFWNANNSQLKVGKCVALSDKAFERAAEVGRCGLSTEEFENINTNGSDMLKHWSYATTPGAPLMYRDQPITVNDVLVVKSIDTIRKFKNVLVYKEDGTYEKVSIKEIKRTAFDGMLLFLVPIPSQQIRGGFAFKGFGLCCAYEDGTTMVEEVGKRENKDVPEFIEDIDGVMRRWKDYKIICTADAWKWAGWSFGENKTKFKYADYCKNMNKLSEKYPTANMIYTARIADATQESKRRLTRQSTQQFITATDEDIEELTARSIRKMNKLMTHEGVIRMMAGLDKPEEERTAFEHLIEVCPEILNNKFMKRSVEDVFNRRVAEAAVRPEVDGIYPYIAEDPAAFIKIIFFGEDPNKIGLGYIQSSQVNIPEEKEGKELYIVRYPNNYICGQLKRNHNDDFYRCVGNVMILSLDGGVLIIADGDTDGDEMCVIKDPVVIKMMKDSLMTFKPSMIEFPHDKLGKGIIKGKDRAKELAHSIVVANKYGPAVGQNSNMATKFFHNASVAYQDYVKTGNKKSLWKAIKSIENAIVAHVAAIIAIDLAKTGKMPAWLQAALKDVSSFAGKKMPWNQRFCKDNKTNPWFDESWDEETREKGDIVDKIAETVINKTNAINYKAPTGNVFDIVDSILGSKDGLMIQGSKGKLKKNEFRSLEARNYRTKDTNSEGDDEFKLIEKLKSDKVDDIVGPADLIRFLWRNQASLVYTLGKDGNNSSDNNVMQNAYFEFCHDILIDFGSYCGNARFMAKSEDARHRSNVWKFMDMAFDENNVIGSRATTEEERQSKKASFALFTVKIFANELYSMACDRKGIENRWIKPSQETENMDCADYGADPEYESIDVGYSDYDVFDSYEC